MFHKTRSAVRLCDVTNNVKVSLHTGQSPNVLEQLVDTSARPSGSRRAGHAGLP